LTTSDPLLTLRRVNELSLRETIMRHIRFALPVSVLFILLLSVSSCIDKDQKQSEIKNLKVVCLGDSITYGHKLANRVAESYPTRLRQLSQGRWQVSNFGVNGATVLVRGDIPIKAQAVYKRVMNASPDVVVLMLGTNDTKKVNWPYIQSFEKDYTGLIERLKMLDSRPHVIACSIPPIMIDYPNGLTASRQQKVNSFVRKVTASTKTDYLDIYAGMAGDSTFFVDGIHPNARGAQKIASLVFAKISSL